MKNKIFLGLAMVVLLITAAWTGYGQKEKSSSSVAYEYAVVYDPIESMAMDEGIAKLNEFGSHGWEIVGIAQHRVYLKRTKR